MIRPLSTRFGESSFFGAFFTSFAGSAAVVSGVADTDDSVAVCAGWDTDEFMIESLLLDENLSSGSEMPAIFNSRQIFAAVGTTNVTAKPATSVAVRPKQTAFLFNLLDFNIPKILSVNRTSQ